MAISKRAHPRKAEKTIASKRAKALAKTTRPAARKSAPRTSVAKKPARTKRFGSAKKSSPKVAAKVVRVHVVRKPPTTRPTKSARALIIAPPSADAPQWTNRLRDGTHVLIRPIRKTDAALERSFIERLSDESRRFRFLGWMKSPSAEFVKRLVDIDYRREMAFVALVHDAGEKKEIGVCRYSIAADGKCCECAVAVADEWQGRGLGALLMRHLIDVAREQGIKKMMSIDANDNTHMRNLARYMGFRRQADPVDAHQVIYSLDL